MNLESHRALALWAADCAEHVLERCVFNGDSRLLHDAINAVRRWAAGDLSVSEARKYSVQIHAIARNCQDRVSVLLARSVGHLIATAHMADHSLKSIGFALDAVEASGSSREEEKTWQISNAPEILIRLLADSRW